MQSDNIDDTLFDLQRQSLLSKTSLLKNCAGEYQLSDNSICTQI